MPELLPYTDEYKDGVLSVLKRDCWWMADKSKETVYKMITPMLKYQWSGDTDVKLSDVPFKYGAVLVDKSNVVGFFGMIYSYRHIEGQKLLVLAPTTWCIDPEYRAHIFTVTAKLYGTADIVLDLTPIKSVLEMDIKLFGFNYFNDKLFVFKPVPALKKHEVNVKFFHEDSDIPDTEHKIFFKDHENRNIRYVSFECSGGTGSLFYKRRYIRKFNRPVWKKLFVVSVSNKKLFTSHLHEIVWAVQKHEKFLAAVEIDSHFTEGDFYHPFFNTKHVDRLMFSKEKLNIKPDFLYSELSIF
ncbi:MAG: hypothetical protein IJR43_11885 [Synergistaceae bacterium]|nr:hypothetical protein [Synergistaceae bacterium]MBR0249624.1 hypothetical protein [Synergistaceae bacterium]